MNDLAPDESTQPAPMIVLPEGAGAIKRPPALPPLSQADMNRAAQLAQGLVRDEARLDDIVTFGSDAQAAAAQVTKDM